MPYKKYSGSLGLCGLEICMLDNHSRDSYVQ